MKKPEYLSPKHLESQKPKPKLRNKADKKAIDPTRSPLIKPAPITEDFSIASSLINA